MKSVHSLIREELCRLVAEIWPEADTDIFDMDCAGGEISAPLGFRPGPDEIWWQERLSQIIKQTPPVLFGHKLLRGISSSGGHLLFHLSDEAYSAILDHIIKNYTAPDIPEDTSDTVSYAAARMLMLSRKGGRGCPGPYKKGIWLCLCVEGFDGKKREAVRKRAAETLIRATDGLSAVERDALREASGFCGGCAARLLTLNPL